jgi:hypothetical protein
LVLTDEGLIPIENVTTAMRVWNGDCWVKHTGVVYQGIKTVIEYDGLVATPDHVVFIPGGGTCEFGDIAAVRGNIREGVTPTGKPKAYKKCHSNVTYVGEVKTYDVTNAGPSHRFTVSGKLVHNCGYGLGHMKFAAMIYSGMLGAKGILFDEKMVVDVKADIRGYAKYLSNKPDLIERLKELKPAKLSNGEWIQHTACAFKIINTFRERNAMIPRLWRTCDKLLAAMLAGDGRDIEFTSAEIPVLPSDPDKSTYDAGSNVILTLKTRKNAVLMPSGMWMHFKDLELNDEGDYSCMRRKDGRVKRVKVYGGMVLENLSQNLAGIIVRHGMVKMKTKYGLRPILQVHDEIVAISGDVGPQQTLNEMIVCMTDVPTWAKGLPLAAEGGFGRSYRDAK